jgi:hypothetical protein
VTNADVTVKRNAECAGCNTRERWTVIHVLGSDGAVRNVDERYSLFHPILRGASSNCRSAVETRMFA